MSISEWMDKWNVVHTYNGTLFTLKRRKILAYAMIWMSLEDSQRSEVSQSQKDKHCVTPLTWGAQGSQSVGGRGRSGGCQGRGGGRHGVGSDCVTTPESQFYKMIAIMETDGGNSCTILQMHPTPLNCTLKMVEMIDFLLCVFYYNNNKKKKLGKNPNVCK